MHAQHIRIGLDNEESVSGLLQGPPNASACYILAHGAGAGMEHPFMATVADGLAQRGIASLRYQFPSMERGSKRADRREVAHRAVRAAVQAASDLVPGVPLIAGGKSFGGRMTSQAQAADPLPGVVGLAFLGFPLHPAGQPSIGRAAHLSQIGIPMLFLQGSRDSLAALPLLTAVVDELGSLAMLRVFEHADHSFHVPARSGTTDVRVMAEMLDVFVGWVAGVV